MKRLKIFTVLATVTSLLLLGSGLGSWHFNAEKNISELKDTGAKPACYFYEYDEASGGMAATRYFTSIGKALKEAERISENTNASGSESMKYKIQKTASWASSQISGIERAGTDKNKLSQNGKYDFYQQFVLSNNKPTSNYAPVISIVVIPKTQSIDPNNPNRVSKKQGTKYVSDSSYYIGDPDSQEQATYTIPQYCSLVLPTDGKVGTLSKKIYEPNIYHDCGDILQAAREGKNNDNNDGGQKNTIINGFNLYNGEGNQIVNASIDPGASISDGNHFWDNNGYLSHNISDQAAKDVSSNLKNNVEIASNTTLSIEEGGSLLIGGSPCCGHLQSRTLPAGNCLGPYSQLTLASGSKVESEGRILSYGYIKEDIGTNSQGNPLRIHNDNLINGSSIVIKNGYLVEPIYLYDFRKEYGDLATDKPDKGDMLLTVFDFPNVRPKLQVYNPASLMGITQIPGKQKSKTSADFYYVNVLDGASDNTKSLLRLGGNNSHCDFRWDGNPFYTDPEKYKMQCGIQKIDIYGDMSLGTGLKLVLDNAELLGKTAEVQMDWFPFPVSYKLDITQHSGTFTLKNAYGGCVFFPGSKFEICNGASAVFPDSEKKEGSIFSKKTYYNSILFFNSQASNYTNTNSDGYILVNNKQSNGTNMPAAQLIIDGKGNLELGTRYFGGKITANGAGATLNVTNSNFDGTSSCNPVTSGKRNTTKYTETAIVASSPTADEKLDKRCQ